MLNEIVLIILLVGFILVFVIVCVILILFVDYISFEYLGIVILIVVIFFLFVCLILIIIGGLFFVIGIVGMDCVLCVNVIIKLGKVVEMVGDIDILLFDKIGIIMIGNCRVMKFYLVLGVGLWEFVIICLLVLFLDEMFEGKFIVELGCELGVWMWSF